jgi:endonuclease III
MSNEQTVITDQLVIERIRAELAARYPEASTSLNFLNPYQLFVATVLSAQTTDQQVNKITTSLFRDFPTVKSLAQAEPDQLEPYLKSCGLYRHKSRFLVEASRIIVEQYQGEIPDNFEELVKLPGVGRKTANVIISNAFGRPALAVDTHVFRVSKRIGLSSAADPAGVEEQLKAVIPEQEWTATHHRLIRHGRTTCHARKPGCDNCFLKGYCLYALERG